MIVVHFNKEFAKTVIDALNNGQPITPPGGKWTGNNMLTLAGMLFASVYSQGPHSYQPQGIPEEIIKKMPLERQEAIDETFTKEIHEGIEFLSTMMFHVLDGNYDKEFNKEVKAIVYSDGSSGKILPAKGFKNAKNMLPE